MARLKARGKLNCLATYQSIKRRSFIVKIEKLECPCKCCLADICFIVIITFVLIILFFFEIHVLIIRAVLNHWWFNPERV